MKGVKVKTYIVNLVANRNARNAEHHPLIGFNNDKERTINHLSLLSSSVVVNEPAHPVDECRR